MSLSGTDLLEIRSIFKEELREELQPIKGELEALSNGIKEIYKMIADLQHQLSLTLNLRNSLLRRSY